MGIREKILKTTGFVFIAIVGLILLDALNGVIINKSSYYKFEREKWFAYFLALFFALVKIALIWPIIKLWMLSKEKENNDCAEPAIHENQVSARNPEQVQFDEVQKEIQDRWKQRIYLDNYRKSLDEKGLSSPIIKVAGWLAFISFYAGPVIKCYTQGLDSIYPWIFSVIIGFSTVGLISLFAEWTIIFRTTIKGWLWAILLSSSPWMILFDRLAV